MRRVPYRPSALPRRSSRPWAAHRSGASGRGPCCGRRRGRNPVEDRRPRGRRVAGAGVRHMRTVPSRAREPLRGCDLHWLGSRRRLRHASLGARRLCARTPARVRRSRRRSAALRRSHRVPSAPPERDREGGGGSVFTVSALRRSLPFRLRVTGNARSTYARVRSENGGARRTSVRRGRGATTTARRCRSTQP